MSEALNQILANEGLALLALAFILPALALVLAAWDQRERR